MQRSVAVSWAGDTEIPAFSAEDGSITYVSPAYPAFLPSRPASARESDCQSDSRAAPTPAVIRGPWQEAQPTPPHTPEPARPDRGGGESPPPANTVSRKAGGGGRRHHWTERQERLRAMFLSDYCWDCYLPDCPKAKDRTPDGPTGQLLRSMLRRLRAGVGKLVFVSDLSRQLLDAFRDDLARSVATAKIQPETANKHLRHLRAVANHAAEVDGCVRSIRWRRFFAEKDPRPQAWKPEELAAIDARARSVTGQVGSVPAATWWTTWWLTISSTGCRITALMRAERRDLAGRVLTLRGENQKQRRTQKFELPAAAAAAIRALLDLHDEAVIFPWPHDPPQPRSGRRIWKTLYKHFDQLLLAPCGITLPKGVKTRQCRRTAVTIADRKGGDGQRLAGHRSRATTDKHYRDPNDVPVIRDPLLVRPETTEQLRLFETEE